MALYAEDPESGAGLVWGSEVQVEISPEDDYKRTSALDPFTRDSIEYTLTCARKQTEVTRSSDNPPRYQNDTPFSTGGDADDESSIRNTPLPCDTTSTPYTDIRGRPRSRTKQLRRRAIDLSRDELRISSKWSIGEKTSMETFRNAIQEKAQNHDSKGKTCGRLAAYARHPLIQDALAMKDRFKRSLRQSVSRNRARRKKEENVHNPAYEYSLAVEPYSPVQMPEITFQHVPNSHSMSKWPTSISSGSDDASIFAAKPVQPINARGRSPACRQTSWQRHLQHDLQPVVQPLRRKKAKYLNQEQVAEKVEVEDRNKERQVLPSDYLAVPNNAMRYGSAAQPLLHPSSSMSALSNHDLARYSRLRSPTTTSFNSSRLFSSSQPQLERLDEIMKLDEAESRFEDSDRNTSFSTTQSSSREGVAGHETTEDLISAFKARLAHATDEHDATSGRPLLQPSVSSRHAPPTTRTLTEEGDRYYSRLPLSRIASRQLVSSMSL